MTPETMSAAAKALAERRKHARVDIYAVTRYFSPSRKEDVGVQTRIADLSEGGALLMTFEEGIPIGTDVLLDFSLPLPAVVTVSVRGKIRHTAPLEKDLFRSGIQFLKVKSKERDAIRTFVSLRSVDPFRKNPA